MNWIKTKSISLTWLSWIWISNQTLVADIFFHTIKRFQNQAHFQVMCMYKNCLCILTLNHINISDAHRNMFSGAQHRLRQEDFVTVVQAVKCPTESHILICFYRFFFTTWYSCLWKICKWLCTEFKNQMK